MAEWKATRYVYPMVNTVLPRCRNTHTLAPLFALRDTDGNLIVDPVHLSTIPPAMFWHNSDGYGFDVRNLSVMLRVNFRNVNPHTVSDDPDNVPRPLWCNADDLSTLLFHPGLQQHVRDMVYRRTALLNLLSDNTKAVLAGAARELYSASYQGFYDWVATQPQFTTLMRALGYETISQRGTMRAIEEVQRRRRRITIVALQTTLGSQAAEHFCEPSGIERESELYSVLEHYKAGVARELVEHLEQLAMRRRRFCDAVERELQAHRESRLVAITTRYSRIHEQLCNDRQRPKLSTRMANRSLVLLWHVRLVAHTDSEDDPDVDIRVSFAPKQQQYAVTLNSMAFAAETAQEVYRTLDDMVPHFLKRGCDYHVKYASIAGGLASRRQQDRRWKRTIRSDNIFLRAQAALWTLRTRFTARVEHIITESDTSPLCEPKAHVRVRRVLDQLGRDFRESMFVDVAHHMAEHAHEIFEFEIINRRQLRSGYDDFEGTLLDKLRATLACRTCAQDVGGELCELLSVPYPPEDESLYAAFQCDHTNIPSLIIPRAPLCVLPITNLRNPEDVFRRRTVASSRPLLALSPSIPPPPPTPMPIEINIEMESSDQDELTMIV